MIQSESVDKIFPAMIKALAKLKSIDANAVNTHFNSKYSTLSETQDGSREILAEHNLIPVQTVRFEANEYHLKTILIHESTQFVGMEFPLILGQRSMQGLGSALTYGKRQQIQALLNIAGKQDDDDGNDASGKGKKENNQGQSPKTDQKTRESKPKEEKPKVLAKDFVMPIGETTKGKKLSEIDTATLGKIHAHMKELQAQNPKPDNIKQVNYIYAMVGTVIKERNEPKPKVDDIPENIDPKTGELYADTMPDYEAMSQEPKGPSIDDYKIPKGTLGLFSDIEDKPLKQISEGELREAIKIIDAENKKGPREGVSISDLFNVRSKIVEFLKSMDVNA